MNYSNPQQIDAALKNIINENEDNLEEALTSILDKLPNIYKDLVEQSFIYKRVPKEYMLSAILFTVSTSIGLTFYIKALGYKNYGNCYFVNIGSRGDAKSEAIKLATAPIKHSDDSDYDKYINDKVIQDDEENVVTRKQVLLQNASIEAAQKIHAENPNSIGLCIDEIFALVEKMANPSSRDGIEWRNFFLEGYTNGHIDVSRKTTDSFRIKEGYSTLLGGLQYEFLPKLFANGNLESGFIDRIFFTTIITTNNKLVFGEINKNIIENYDTAVRSMLAYKRQSEKKEETVKQFEIKLTKNAHQMIFNYTQQLIYRKAQANTIIKEYYAKMQISIHKLCILVFMMKHSTKSTFKSELTENDVNLAIEINEFYFLNFEHIIKNNMKQKGRLISSDDVIKMAKKNNASQKAVVEITGLSKGQVSKKWNNK